jgi:flagellar assembly protein FliH
VSAPEDAVARWSLPPVSGTSVQGRKPGRTVGELQDVERRTQQEAFAQGRDAGLAAAKTETEAQLELLRNRVARLDRILSALAQPLHDLDAEVEQQLLSLSLAIAKQLVRRELRIDPTQVIAVIRETVAILPASARDARVYLHPDDAAIVRDKLASPAQDRAWTIFEDPMMTRGGCRVTSESAQIDARVEARMAAAIAAVLGEDRSQARAKTDTPRTPPTDKP